MAKPRKKIGRIKCGCCGESVPLTEQANGWAMYVCQFCDYKGQAFSAAADAALRRRAGLTPAANPEPKQEPKPEPAPAPKATPRSIAGALSQLLES
ncbi:hypothetical protein ACTSKR_09555 [Chitinibacteraceae bacterium HSL-7]